MTVMIRIKDLLLRVIAYRLGVREQEEFADKVSLWIQKIPITCSDCGR